MPDPIFPVAPPVGRSGVVSQFGSIVVRDGKIVAPKDWERRSMTLVSDLPGWPRRIYVHKAIVEPLRWALGRCVELRDGYVVRTLGCFNPRAKRSNPSALSLHSWGIAVDMNASTNPYGAPLRTDIPAAWIEIWERAGWTWGGRWRTPDPMHWQWARGV